MKTKLKEYKKLNPCGRETFGNFFLGFISGGSLAKDHYWFMCENCKEEQEGISKGKIITCKYCDGVNVF